MMEGARASHVVQEIVQVHSQDRALRVAHGEVGLVVALAVVPAVQHSSAHAPLVHADRQVHNQ